MSKFQKHSNRITVADYQIFTQLVIKTTQTSDDELKKLWKELTGRPKVLSNCSRVFWTDNFSSCSCSWLISCQQTFTDKFYDITAAISTLMQFDKSRATHRWYNAHSLYCLTSLFTIITTMGVTKSPSEDCWNGIFYRWDALKAPKTTDIHKTIHYTVSV